MSLRKQPIAVRLLLACCLTGVLGAMVWLTRKAIELDLAEARAQQLADQEEAIGSALWQMDAALTAILAPEIARPPRAFSRPTIERADPITTSLVQPPNFTLLHFELAADGGCISPQVPEARLRGDWLDNGATEAGLLCATQRAEEADRLFDYATLLAGLPEQTVPSDLNRTIGQGSQRLPINEQPVQVVRNTLDDEGVQRQIEVQPRADAAWDESPNQEAVQPQRVASRQQRSSALRNRDLQNRGEFFQSMSQQAVAEAQNYRSNSEDEWKSGVSRPVWIGDQLLLARRVYKGRDLVIQGCWLDWPRLKQQLLAMVESSVPDADLRPVAHLSGARLSRVLASIPAEIVVPEPLAVPRGWTPIRISLWIAWAALLLSVAALGVLMRGIVALSERRAAFVSAVTHELRTPLTTFRMYSEMLAEGMITDETRRRGYLETLRAEADRLAHLVENVLQYARLERGNPGRRREFILVRALVDRIRPRLEDRARQAEMTVELNCPDDVADSSVLTDPTAVDQILFNLIDNACKYASDASDRRLQCDLEISGSRLCWTVRDHGPGIPARDARRIFHPFAKSAQHSADTPGVGLGLALSRRLAIALGGRLDAVPCEAGAALRLQLPLANAARRSPS